MAKASRQLELYYVRLGFPNIWEAKPIMMNGRPKGDPIFSAQVVIDAYDPNLAAMVQKIQQAENEIIAIAWPNGVPAVFKKGLMWGPEVHPKDKNVATSWVLHANAKAEDPPQVVMENPPGSGVTVPLTKETARDLVYSGCEAHVGIGLFDYTRSAGDGGIGVALNLIMPTGRSFPRFDNRATGQTMLAGLAGATAPDAPAPAAMPAEQAGVAPPGVPGTAPVATAQPPEIAAPPAPGTPGTPQIPQPTPIMAQPERQLSPDGRYYWEPGTQQWLPVS